MKGPVTTGCLLALVASIAGCSDEAGPPERSLGLDPAPARFESWARSLQGVCEPAYAGDPLAPAFDPNEAGPHGLVFIAEDGSAHALNNTIPENWRPKSLSAVELVACVSDVETQSVEACEYLGTSVTVDRRQRFVDIRVIPVRSGGATVTTVHGGLAPDCPAYVSVTGKRSDVVGSLPSASDVRQLVVDRYVPVPECGGKRSFASCLQCWSDEAEAGSSGCGHSSNPRRSTKLVRPGTPTILTWESEVDGGPLYRDAVGIDWSHSPASALLDVLEGEVTTVTAPRAGTYEVVARAVLPARPDGQALDTHSYTIEALDPPSVELEMGDMPVIRVGVQQPTANFRAQVSARPQFGRPGEVFRFTWAEAPADSRAALPAIVDSQQAFWWFNPDVSGEYRVQLEYSDGLGFSEPVVSGPILALDAPLLSVDREEWTGAVGETVAIHATVMYSLGSLDVTWTLVKQPAASAAVLQASSFDAGFVPDVVGTYVVEVVATDDGGTSNPVTVSITVQ